MLTGTDLHCLVLHENKKICLFLLFVCLCQGLSTGTSPCISPNSFCVVARSRTRTATPRGDLSRTRSLISYCRAAVSRDVIGVRMSHRLLKGYSADICSFLYLHCGIFGARVCACSPVISSGILLCSTLIRKINKSD